MIVWMGGCMLACSGICLWAIRRSEAAFYTRASLLMSAAPESAGKMMQALKNGLPEQEAAGAGLLKRYGYEAGLFAFHDFAGLAVRLLLCFLLLGAAGFFCYLWDDRLKKILLGHLSKENNYEELAYETVRLEIDEGDCPYGASDFSISVASRDCMSEIIYL